MGAHRYGRRVRRRTVGFVAFAVALVAVLGGIPAVAGAASPPSIDSVSVSGITNSDATLEAEINTEGFESTYEFHLQEAPLCFEANPPCERPQREPPTLPSGKLLGSFVDQSVSADLNSAGVSLSPNEHYEYWVTATNTAGTVTGPARDFTAPERPTSLNAAITPPSGGGSSSASGSRVPGSSASRPTPSAGTSSKPPSAEPSSSKHRVKRRHQRHQSQSRTLVTYNEEQGGIVFRIRFLLVSADGEATVRFGRCMAQFHLNAALWKRLRAALKQTNLHAVAGDYVPPTLRADESTWVITVGHDRVRITGFSIPQELRVKLEPLLKVLGEVRSVGERRMPPSCSSKWTSRSMR
jgi:hypothetical protein